VKVTKSRSLVKSITWRVVAVITTFVSLYVITGELKIAGAGTVLTNSVNFVCYYWHERIWDKINWGRNVRH
jgi:adenylylsulfate kinase